MRELLDHLLSLPGSVLALYGAIIVASLMLIIVAPDFIKMKFRRLLGLKKKSGYRNYSNKRYANRTGTSSYKKGSTYYNQGSKRYQRTGEKGSYSKGGSYQKKGSFFGFKKDSNASKMRSRSINGYEYNSKSSSASKISPKLDFLSPQQECISGFKHGPVSAYYKELLKPGPACDLKAPDLDELDETFTVMLKAGAVQKKNFLVTDFEHQYLQKLRMWFADRYEIYCQVSVGSSLGIDPDVSNLPAQQRRTFAQKCHNMSFDFMLVDRATDRITCVVELDDPTHMRGDRKARDRRLDKVCAAANLPIFHITKLEQKPDLNGL